MRRELGRSLPYPRIVLNGLDDIDARHEAQKIWPDLAIDGAIGADFHCQVSCHPWPGDPACLICLFQHPATERVENIHTRATGLPAALIDDPDARLTEAHVASAAKDKRTWLAERVGRTICSVTSEAVTKLLSADTHRSGFEPSVPFVACMSACMVVTELVRFLATGETVPEPRFAFNLLWGPQRGEAYPEDRHRDCICVRRATNIDKVRSMRALAQDFQWDQALGR